MARTTSTKVQNILVNGKNYDGTTALDDFILTANVLVDELVSYATSKSLTLSDALLERIEAWLAAHFYAIADPLYESKATGKATATFQGKTAMGFDATTYGQQAKRMDLSGFLSSMDRGKTQVGIAWLGKAPSKQIDFEDRD